MIIVIKFNKLRKTIINRISCISFLADALYMMLQNCECAFNIVI